MFSRRAMATVGLALATLAAGKPATQPAKPAAGDDALNQAVLKFAAAQVGKKVGNGECWTLAAEALKAAGAKHARGYTYGHKLAAGDPVKPGDIMQFTSARFAGKSGRRTWSMSLGFPNHTAVVKAVLGPGRYQILQQNPGPVSVATIDFKDLKSGTYEVWRAEPKPGATTEPDAE
jgi:hypothetical protein